MSKESRICLICGKSFVGSGHQNYCTPGCKRRAQIIAEQYNSDRYIREAKFAALLKYVEDNNMREILAKYKPNKGASI